MIRDLNNTDIDVEGIGSFSNYYDLLRYMKEEKIFSCCGYHNYWGTTVPIEFKSIKELEMFIKEVEALD